MIDWLFPKLIEIRRSKVNGEIKIKKYQGKFEVWVGGFQQSGPMVEKLWKKGLSLPEQGETLRKILILGFGCGSVVPIIYRKWPKAKIVGVEIDGEMIKVAQRHFFISRYKNLKVVCADAQDFLSTTKQKYDLIISDCFLGGSNSFSKNLKKHLNKNGVILVNKLENLKNVIEITSRFS